MFSFIDGGILPENMTVNLVWIIWFIFPMESSDWWVGAVHGNGHWLAKFCKLSYVDSFSIQPVLNMLYYVSFTTVNLFHIYPINFWITSVKFRNVLG